MEELLAIEFAEFQSHYTTEGQFLSERNNEVFREPAWGFSTQWIDHQVSSLPLETLPNSKRMLTGGIHKNTEWDWCRAAPGRPVSPVLA